jgi:hypothetical protein
MMWQAMTRVVGYATTQNTLYALALLLRALFLQSLFFGHDTKPPACPPPRICRRGPLHGIDVVWVVNTGDCRRAQAFQERMCTGQARVSRALLLVFGL